jgi:hypothetical protein
VKADITPDLAEQIRELADKGHGCNWIGHLLDVNASAVKAVLQGTRVTYSNKLSTRQRQNLINSAFGSPSGR